MIASATMRPAPLFAADRAARRDTAACVAASASGMAVPSRGPAAAARRRARPDRSGGARGAGAGALRVGVCGRRTRAVDCTSAPSAGAPITVPVRRSGALLRRAGRRAVVGPRCSPAGASRVPGALAAHERLEREAHLGRGREAHLGTRRHRAVHEPRDLGRDVRRHVHERLHLAALDLEHDDARILALRGRLAGEHLVEHDADRVDVGARVDVGRRVRLLGRHVLGRAHQHAGDREVLRPAPVAPSARFSFAMPKSISLRTGLPPSNVTKTLSGLRSRCTTPSACAASSAWRICERVLARRGDGERALALLDAWRAARPGAAP